MLHNNNNSLFSNNSSSSSNQQLLNNFSIISFLFELFLLHPFVIIISNLNIFVLLTTRVLHQNMSVVLLVQSFSIVGFEINRIYGIIQRLITNDFYYNGSIIIQVN
jgi:hypothetical protein